MRRLVVLCLAAAVSGYNLVLQDFTLSGGLITSDEPTITCDNIAYLHIGNDDKDGRNFYCYNVTSETDDSLQSITLEYKSGPINSKAKNLNVLIILRDQSNVTFTFTPEMKTGKVLTFKPEKCNYNPLVVATTAAPTTAAPVCDSPETKKTKDCDAYCALDEHKTEECCERPPTCKAAANPQSKAKKIFKPEDPAAVAPKPAAPEVPAVPVAAVNLELPAAIRFRGPGPVVRPSLIIRDSPEDTVVAEDDDEERRVRRAAEDDDPGVDQGTTVFVAVTYYVLDEAGNPAAVWAAVIEGIILLVLVGLCFWFFFWSPRARTAATTAADPYKDSPNYSVSYANSSYNNQNGQRIDAFQNQPAAPPRPANSAYMDDYITDNIGAMARPAAAAAAPTPAASAINPASTAFQPGHQRYDSSGLVTVNLS